ncbi:uncharacterized protein LOC132755758 isoform X2 [Ruditapes philippinarum]|uniref:uncharacterized protein LOC132755758 isoform X2 n=1 Tax=Ruditapes philippinarum TaxID=129788 RepID=UPI00295C0014|nr:uncharacterized protein LOC132755758 isoform X2 [Ruditapes philippinarum]
MENLRKCSLCLDCDDEEDASVFCKQCKQYLCTDCKEDHFVIPDLQNHNLVSVEEGVSLEEHKNCDLCIKRGKTINAVKRCVDCMLLLCHRCSRRHCVNTKTQTHTQVDLSAHPGDDVGNRSSSECSSYSELLETSDQDHEVSCSGMNVETAYYIRFVLLLIKGGTRVLRNLLLMCLEKKKITLEHFLRSYKKIIQASQYVKREQMEILYPDPPKTSDIREWDIQLLCFILIEYFKGELNTPEELAVKKIREMRNDFYAHYAKACIDRNTYYSLWSELSLIMTTIGAKMPEYEKEKNDNLISKLCSTKLDMNSATMEIRNLNDSDEFINKIKQCLNNVFGMNLHIIKQDLTEIKDALNSLIVLRKEETSEQKHAKIVNTVYGAVHVYARTQNIVEKAEAQLLAASNQSTDGTEVTANKELSENFNKLKEDIEETGVNLTRGDRGSIIFTFESHSAHALLKLIEFFESTRMKTHLQDISKNLQNILGEKINLTAYILRDSLFEALRQMKCQTHEGTVWFNMKCTGIEGLQHALTMFEEGGASNYLNKMSEILTHSIGETITLETSIDIEHLQRVIIITKQQLALPNCSRFIEDNADNGEITNRAKRARQNVNDDDEKSATRDKLETYVSNRSKSYPETGKDYNVYLEKIENDRPGKPEASEISSDTVNIAWKSPSKFGKEDYYQIYYTTDMEDRKRKWKKFQVEPNYHSATLSELKTNTTYIFRVKAVYDDEEGPYSPESDRITTSKSLALRLLNKAIKIEDGKQPPYKYILPMTEIISARNEENKTKKYEIGVAAKGYVKSKTILLVGATGTGKSTLVDGIANYALGVNWEDPFRFSVLNLEEHEKKRSENQAISQTDWITCYTINQEPGSRLAYQLNVIDTPGFGDTAGPIRDQKIADQLRKLFEEEKEPKGVTYIDAVCFLVKSPDARLTVFQDYIFKSVMALFGKDMESNIYYFITFADNKNPPVLAAMSEIGLPKGETFLFNNSGLFETNTCKDTTNAASLFWRMGLQSYRAFLEYIARLQSRSLQQTKDVLDQRYKLEGTVTQLQPLLDLGLSKVYSLKQEKKILEENYSKIEDNKYFAYEVEEIKKERRELPSGERATQCLNCNLTCHDKCANEHDLKFECIAFDSDGYCMKCPNKCHRETHKSTTYKLDYVSVKVKKEYDNMRQKYREASGKALTQEQVIDKLVQELEKTSKDIKYLMFVVKSCTDKLSDIALRPNPLNMTDYIDLIIENETYDRKEGFQERIKVLKDFRKKAGIEKEFERFSEEAVQILKNIEKSKAGLFVPDFEMAKSLLDGD